MPTHSAPFIIEPYMKPNTIRSPLGFMSQATYWAQLLFPGVTVLTRHFLHVQLLLRELRRKSRTTESRQEIEKVLRSQTVHRRLEREYKAAVGIENDLVITKMTYWQRYASMFEYFGLWKAPRTLRPRELWQIVFYSRVPRQFRKWVKPEAPEKRRRRIAHTLWYLRFKPDLEDAHGQPQRIPWWVTGEGCPRDVSVEIRLSRRVSYAFLIWQTLFEVGIKLRCRGTALPKASNRMFNAWETVELLELATQDPEPSTDTLKRVFSGLLSAHAHQLQPSMPTWQTVVERQPWHESSLTRLYDGSSVRDLAAVQAASLFARLVHLHQYYCERQGKTDAEFIRANANGFTALKSPKISAQFQGTPWGLFGYRLDQAVALYRSGAPP
ncbi:MAG: hypothetical protein NDI90_16025 [Nitrospira sp. BO4]|nr:hypothetical protein [Nitrospira sp. BO4]